MWVIVAMSLSVSDGPKLTIVPGHEYQTEAECVRDTRVRGGYEPGKGGGVDFSFCVPKDSVQIGAAPGSDADKK